VGYVVDSSAIIAIVRREPTADAFIDILASATGHVIGAPTLVETLIVLEARAAEAGRQAAQSLIALLDIEPAPFESAHTVHAVSAFRAYGKGRHPAALNLGDCLTYAIAKASGRAIVCAGDDFTQTDIATIRP
jgi:ribonuclease VapC